MKNNSILLEDLNQRIDALDAECYRWAERWAEQKAQIAEYEKALKLIKNAKCQPDDKAIGLTIAQEIASNALERIRNKEERGE